MPVQKLIYLLEEQVVNCCLLTLAKSGEGACEKATYTHKAVQHLIDLNKRESTIPTTNIL